MSKCIHSAAELTPLPAYTLIKEEYLDDIKSLGLVFRHNKSGARVCVLSSEEENKTFCAAFRTTPSDMPFWCQYLHLTPSRLDR